MSSKKLSAGDFVDARCTRCKLVTNHTIVAMVGEQVVRVMCNTCNGTHNYHAPKTKTERVVAAKSAAAKAPKTPRMTAKAAKTADEEEWLESARTADPAKARRYDMNGAFTTKDLISHPTFGFGIVKAVFKPNKIEVLFEDGRKMLRCKI